MLSSPVLAVNCAVTAPSYDVTHLLITDDNDVRADVIVNADQNAPISYPLRVSGASIGTLCLLAGVLGNLLVLFSVWRYRPLRRAVNLFVASLAVCDLTQTLAVRTLYIQTFVAGRWTLGTRACVYALVVSRLVILEDIVKLVQASATYLECWHSRND